MTEHTAARTPAALAEHLGLTVPQLAQRLATPAHIHRAAACITTSGGESGRGPPGAQGVCAAQPRAHPPINRPQSGAGLKCLHVPQ